MQILSHVMRCTALVGAALFCLQPAIADQGGIEEIVVTAQKRVQSLQEVPVSVTVVGAMQL